MGIEIKKREVTSVPAYKDEQRGTWYCQFYYEDWQGNKKKKQKRGFKTKREAIEWENSFKLSANADMDMTLGAFVEIYFRDKNDIVDQIFLNEIILPMKQLRSLSSSLEMPTLTILSWIYEQLYKDRLFYTRINYFNGQNSLFNIIIEHTSEIIAEKINPLPLPTHTKEYSIYFYAASHSLIIKKWINEGMQVHPKEMAKMYELWTIPNFENMAKESNRN